MKHYDIIIIGAGPGGIFSAYELATKRPDLKIAVFEAGNRLEKRKCPIDGKRVTKCIHCKTCGLGDVYKRQLQNLCNHEWIWRCRCLL